VNGDLVISLERMRDQAKRYRISEGRELARLVIHGALHLAGLDHHRAAERRIMRAREDAALRAARSAVSALDRAVRTARPR
jgi:probable rRNA maturation factor